MKSFLFGLMLLATFSLMIPAALVSTTNTAEARRAVFFPNYGYCLSGKKVRNVRNCREFGGRW